MSNDAQGPKKSKNKISEHWECVWKKGRKPFTVHHDPSKTNCFHITITLHSFSPGLSWEYCHLSWPCLASCTTEPLDPFIYRSNVVSSPVSVLLDTPPGSLQFLDNNCPAVIIPNLSLQVPHWQMCYWVASPAHWKCFCNGSMTTTMKATSCGHSRCSCVR